MNPGLCTYVAELYPSPSCAGLPGVVRAIPAGQQCVDDFQPVVGQPTVGAKAIPVGVGSGTCAEAASATPTQHDVCALKAAGCPADKACLQGGAIHADACFVFDGDVDCPRDKPRKELIFPTSVNSCSCDCAVTDQKCSPPGTSAEEHYHAKADSACSGGKFDVASESCVDTGIDMVHSLEDHDGDLPPALSASCVYAPTTPPQGTRTLCCNGL